MNILNVLGFAPTVAILGGIVSKAAPIVVVSMLCLYMRIQHKSK